jgi:hypothetical protein
MYLGRGHPWVVEVVYQCALAVDRSLDGAIVLKELPLRYGDDFAQSGTVGGYRFMFFENIFDQLSKVCRRRNYCDYCGDASDFVFAEEVATKAG